MRPENLKTKVFLDGGDPHETKEILDLLGFLDGQTTNPTLVARNPDIQKKCADGCDESVVYEAYRGIVSEIAGLIPDGSISVEVYADKDTDFETMFTQSKDMYAWIPNAHIKFPTTEVGLAAAERAVTEGMRVNMTLCFSQTQAAAVHAATKLANDEGQVFVSPFIGRLDDIGLQGVDLIKNIVDMYAKGKSHVKVLSASIRTLDHLLASFHVGADIVTVPGKVIKEWVAAGMPVPDDTYLYETDLESIAYDEIALDAEWNKYDIAHDLTTKGIEKFAHDWNALVK
ncbi:MAG: transaldolase family protein [Patescibacteria group bacterium]